MTTIKDQNIKLLNDILERNYYFYYRKNNDKNISISLLNNNFYNNSIFIKDNLITNDYNNVLLNLDKIFNWYIENNFCCDIIFEDINEILNIKEDFFALLKKLKKSKIKTIYFRGNPIKCNKIILDFFNEQINIFKENNIDLIFIFDINLENDDFKIYNDAINFCQKNNFNIKIMISTQNLKYQKKFFLEIIKNLSYNNILFYEKEEENWNEENLNQYINFLNFYIDFIMKDKSIDDFLNILFKEDLLFSIKDQGIISNQDCSGKCKFYKNLHLIANDLSITMCKKIQYEELTIGSFEVIDNKITKCIPNNISALIVNTHSKRNMTPQCEYCEYIGICKGFCHGEVYYKTLNPLVPIRESCLLRKAKYSFIFYKLLKLNLYEKILLFDHEYTFKGYLQDILDNISNNMEV